MAGKKKQRNKAVEEQLVKDYETLMSTSNRTTVGAVQWKEDGDVIEQYTTYEEYTPVKTSSSTTLNC